MKYLVRIIALPVVYIFLFQVFIVYLLKALASVIWHFSFKTKSVKEVKGLFWFLTHLNEGINQIKEEMNE